MAVQPSFQGFLKASGQAEVWDDVNDHKFSQFGWRTTTNESSYSIKTLIGNWSEESFDVRHISQASPLPSQFNHYFETTYSLDYNSNKPRKVPDGVRFSQEPRAFPGHQPALDTPQMKQSYSQFLTTSREAYTTPRRHIRRESTDSLISTSTRE